MKLKNSTLKIPNITTTNRKEKNNCFTEGDINMVNKTGKWIQYP